MRKILPESTSKVVAKVLEETPNMSAKKTLLPAT